MQHTHRSTSRKLCVAALWLLTQSLALPAIAADDSLERERLAALTRQLDLVNRLADQADAISPPGHRRYHFDYARLREDVQRMRAGVEDYLTPQRAQPRDPVPLAGNYTRDTGNDTEAPRP